MTARGIKTAQQQRHVIRLRVAEAVRMVLPVDSELATLLTHLPSTFPIFLAEYPYGIRLFGPRAQDDYFGGFLPPCGLGEMCSGCADVSVSCQDSLPLYIVLTNVAEEFLEYNEENINFNDPSLSVPRRFVPTRLSGPGEFLGLSEFLNRITGRGYRARPFKAPVRNATAGARSCFVSLSFRADALFRRLAKLDAGSIPVPYRSAAVLRYACANDNWLLLKILAKAAERIHGAEPWTAKLLILPAKALSDFFQKTAGAKGPGQQLLIYLFSAGWQASRGLMSESIRHTALADTLQGEPDDSVADRIILRLLLIKRGDVPGFAPTDTLDRLGPFASAQRYFIQSGLSQAAGQDRDRFLPIVCPAHFGRGPCSRDYFYFSVSAYPTTGPTGDIRSRIKVLERIQDRIDLVKRNNPGLLADLQIEYYVSELDKKSLRRRTAEIRPSISNVQLLGLSEQIKKDFSEQLKLASEYFDALRIIPFAIRPGFLSRFMRISRMR